jgi:hypothetical protein
MPLPTLQVSRLIDVDVTLSPLAAQGQNTNALLILDDTSVIDVVTRIRTYTTIAQVAADFGTSVPAYLAAALWFEQNPQPTELLIGRWAQGASHGQLFGGALTPTQQLMSFWNAITTGSMHITIDGGSPESLTGLNFSAALNMNGVAAVINAALTGASCVWNSVYNRFEFTSATTGATSTVSFVTAGAGGVDISTDIVATSTSPGAYLAPGIAAETALAAVTLFDTDFGMTWFGLTVIGAVDADVLAIAGYIEAANNKHYYGVTTQEPAVLTPGDTTSIAYKLQQLAYNNTGVQYSSTSPYAVVSMLARILTTNYQENSSVITLMYKQEPGVVAENLTETQMEALEAKNCNVFVFYNNNTAIIEPGVSSSGNFIDTVIGVAVLAIDLQTALYNLLYLSPTKIPQTDAGTHQLVTVINGVLNQYVANGLLAPGTWDSNGFGTLNTGDPLPAGFYIYAPPVALQPQSARAARVSVPIQIAAKLAGAVHTVDVSINVNS